jgi:hypothetical protein
VDELIACNLIAKSEDNAETVTLPPTEPKLPWAPPIVERYTDMQMLLQLDPVHDVSDEGWPRVSAEPRDGSS